MQAKKYIHASTNFCGGETSVDRSDRSIVRSIFKDRPVRGIISPASVPIQIETRPSKTPIERDRWTDVKRIGII